jgi:glutamate-1-semialdehyde 2,1-aminomutase
MDHELQGAIHLYLLNRGVLITPFHNMMLCSPATQELDVDQLVEAFDDCLANLTRRY